MKGPTCGAIKEYNSYIFDLFYCQESQIIVEKGTNMLHV